MVAPIPAENFTMSVMNNRLQGRPLVRAAVVVGLVGLWALNRTQTGARLGARLARR
jgi:hypothetical protein